ncbi:hypothetical protein PV325_007350 [Microctonus aethiopoides]|nr:hypothetical protein PV325_007350 [Microctonus aethiopoides]
MSHMCPESWCKWRKSDTEGTLDTFEYSPALDDDAQATLKPQLAQEGDPQRICRADRQSTSASKEARTARKKATLKK